MVTKLVFLTLVMHFFCWSTVSRFLLSDDWGGDVANALVLPNQHVFAEPWASILGGACGLSLVLSARASGNSGWALWGPLGIFILFCVSQALKSSKQSFAYSDWPAWAFEFGACFLVAFYGVLLFHGFQGHEAGRLAGFCLLLGSSLATTITFLTMVWTLSDWPSLSAGSFFGYTVIPVAGTIVCACAVKPTPIQASAPLV